MSDELELWQAIVTCDSTYDGKFFYGVRSTGIVCRPSCKSRTPSAKNVQIFSSMQEALSSGFRACKRCRPDQQFSPEEDLVSKATQLIDRLYTEPLTLQRMGELMHVSPFHLHRTFHRRVGLTPADYLRHVRFTAAVNLLRETETSITDIAMAVGYPNAGHFATSFQRQYGVTPSAYRKKHLARLQSKEEHHAKTQHHYLLGFIDS